MTTRLIWNRTFFVSPLNLTALAGFGIAVSAPPAAPVTAANAPASSHYVYYYASTLLTLAFSHPPRCKTVRLNARLVFGSSTQLSQQTGHLLLLLRSELGSVPFLR